MLAPAALAALLLTADGPNIHFGGEIGVGFGVPFNLATAGFQMSAKPYLEIEVVPKLGVGIAIPFAVGFNAANGNSSFATVNFTSVDIMPGIRASYAILDWVFAALDFGLGPNILSTKTDVNFFGQTMTDQRSSTYFATRFGLEVLVAPPQLSGVTFAIQPLEIDGRVGNSNNVYSEYRFSVLVGFRH